MVLVCHTSSDQPQHHRRNATHHSGTPAAGRRAQLVHAFVHARPTTTWTRPDRTTLSGPNPEPSICRSEPFWLVRRHIGEGPPVRLLIRREGFETLAAHCKGAGQRTVAECTRWVCWAQSGHTRRRTARQSKAEHG